MSFAFSLFICLSQYEFRHSFVSNRLELYHYFRVKLSQIGQWESLRLAPVPFKMFLPSLNDSFFLAQDVQAHLHVSLSRPGSSHFSKDSEFLLVRKGLWNQGGGIRYTH